LAAAGGALAFAINYLQRVLGVFGEDYDLAKTVNMRNALGAVPLHYASAYGHGEMVVFLIGQRGDANALDKSDRTPLVHAVVNDERRAIEALCNNGADITRRDVFGARHRCWRAT
jgi:ankyrin repeat protein